MWLKRLDADLFEDFFLAILITLEVLFFNFEDKHNKKISVKANSLLKLIFNFDFIVKLVISCHILDCKNSVTQIDNRQLTIGIISGTKIL